MLQPIQYRRISSKKTFTEQEMHALRHAFYQSYRDAGGEIPGVCLCDFYEMYVKLRRLVTKSGYRKETDRP